MSEQITDDELRAWKELEQAATKGPWFYNSYSSIHSKELSQRYGELAKEGQGDRTKEEWRELLHANEPVVARVPAHHGDTAIGHNAKNAWFIAAVRTAVPRLIAEVERLRAACKVFEAMLDGVRWRPMEEMPESIKENGDFVLLTDGKNGPDQCQWDWSGMGHDEWSACGGKNKSTNSIRYEPTYWMPLPSPPEAKP